MKLGCFDWGLLKKEIFKWEPRKLGALGGGGGGGGGGSLLLCLI